MEISFPLSLIGRLVELVASPAGKQKVLMVAENWMVPFGRTVAADGETAIPLTLSSTIIWLVAVLPPDTAVIVTVIGLGTGHGGAVHIPALVILPALAVQTIGVVCEAESLRNSPGRLDALAGEMVRVVQAENVSRKLASLFM